MSYPTLEEKLAALKVSPPSEYERRCADALAPGSYEIGVQRTADILDEGYEMFMRSSRSSMGVAGDSIVAIFNAARRPGERLGRDLPARGDPADRHQVHPAPGTRRTPASPTGTSGTPTTRSTAASTTPTRSRSCRCSSRASWSRGPRRCSHTTETGAFEPGGMPLSAKARFEEGMNLPPMKIGTNFRLNDDVIEMFAAFGLRAEANGHRRPAGPLPRRPTGCACGCWRCSRGRARTSSSGCSAGCSTRPSRAPASGSRTGPTAPTAAPRSPTPPAWSTGLLRNCSMTMTKGDDHLAGRLHRHQPGERLLLQRPPAGGHRAPAPTTSTSTSSTTCRSARRRSSRSTSCSRRTRCSSPDVRRRRRARSWRRPAR